ncbi:MAG: HAD family hydrolase [Myxococcota bacterium]
MLIAFDIDDTLVTHSQAVEIGVRELHQHRFQDTPLPDFRHRWREAHRRRYPEFLFSRQTHADMCRARVRDVADGSLSDQEATSLFAVYFEAYEREWRVFGDVIATLDRLDMHKLAVISNGPSGEQRRKLDRLNLTSRFSKILISEECAWAKPEPEIFLQLCELCDSDPSSSVYIGDHPELDAMAANAAGLNGIWLDRLSDRTQVGEIRAISTLSELPATIEAMSTS